jgi:itaconate CoA-transferase
LKQPNLIYDPRFSQNPDRYLNRVALDQIVNTVFAKMSQEEVILMLDSAHIANAKLNDVADLSTHPFLRNSTAKIGTAHVEMAALPVCTARHRTELVPGLGEHTKKIRKEFTK